ncbi:MAG: hypothetical protein AABX33_03865 [Nanoarchaeota archaeon]
MAKCPKCGSENIQYQGYLNIKAIKCNNCSFDESSVYEVYPEQKTSQKAKGKYAVYKKGGSLRTRKR